MPFRLIVTKSARPSSILAFFRDVVSDFVDEVLADVRRETGEEAAIAQRSADRITETRARRYFEDVAKTAERHLRQTVPVRTGLMRRRVDGRGRLPRVAIYSDAKNRRNKEYAQYVRRYHIALQDTEKRVVDIVRGIRLRHSVYERVRGGTAIRRRTVYTSGRRFIVLSVQGTRLMLRYRTPLALREIRRARR